ncbi:MAG TPA: SGNH hydrolase domain-containing protein [Solirubrobacteraceae bacterium]|nr:SGNH hydrolase domain-containing protein [Solirubrobacteraceae bacterium]
MTATRLPPWAAILAALALALLAAPLAIAAEPGGAGATASTTADPVDAQGPLDLAEVTVGQRDVRMTLRIVTTGVWDSLELSSAPGRELCVTLVPGEGNRARICITRRNDRTALDLAALAADGTALVARGLAADLSRPRPNVFEASFLPAAAGLSIGPFQWYADSAWTDPTVCAATCRDRAPDTGDVAAGVVLLAVAPCFGAAARDSANPCDNPDLRNTVEPPPERAKVVTDPFCDNVEHRGFITACSFGAAPEDAERTFALIGDSHAANLKHAVLPLTVAKRWRGISILRSGCPLTRAKPILGSPLASRQCRTWNGEMFAWLRGHPEVETVFLSAHAGARVKSYGGRSAKASVRAGYRAAISELLRMRRGVVVVRDTPPSTRQQLRCVSRAIAARRRAQTECTRPRSASVRPDPLVAAARAARSANVKVIDLTRVFCDSRRCFAVIGGALVRHDESHLTQAFAVTLGPLILRALGG